jgi:hypothetical protein
MSSPDHPPPRVDLAAARLCYVCGGWGTVPTTGAEGYVLCAACQTGPSRSVPTSHAPAAGSPAAAHAAPAWPSR